MTPALALGAAKRTPAPTTDWLETVGGQVALLQAGQTVQIKLLDPLLARSRVE